MSTHFRVITAEGRSAIAVVRIWGPGAVAVVDAVFRPRRGGSIAATEPGRLRLGRAGAGLGDEVVAVRLDEPTPTVEIQCHGGTAAVAAVTRALEEAGAIPAVGAASALPGFDDRLRAEAMEDLAAASTLRTAEILLDQAQGALSGALATLLAEARRTPPPASTAHVLAGLDALIRAAEIGIRLLRGWTVVIAGRPNVGKSRLFNALAGFERSIVNPRAGVTRDVVSVRTAFGGWPVDLSDTAGEREAAEAVERLGIGRARQVRREADVVVLVLDRSEPLQGPDRELLAILTSAVVVANKGDLPPAWPIEETGRDDSEVCSVSSATGEGLDRLIRAIEARLVPSAPADGSAVPFRTEHLRALTEARARLVAGDVDGFARRLTTLDGRGRPL